MTKRISFFCFAVKGTKNMCIINYEQKPFGLSGSSVETTRETYNTEDEFRKALEELLINSNNRGVFRLRYR